MASLGKQLQLIGELKKELLVEEGLLIDQALKSNNPNDIIKASEIASRFFEDITYKGNRDQKTIMYNPLDSNSFQGYREKPVAIGDDMIRRMAKEPITNAIIGTRIDQIAAHCEPQPDKYSSGFIIRKKKIIGEDQSDVKNSHEENRIINKITDFICNCGDEVGYYRNDNDFDSFTRMVMRDSLTLDKLTFEIINDRRGNVLEFFGTDSAEMKLALNLPNQDFGRQRKMNFLPKYCQVIENEIVADYYPWEMGFGIRNKTTDVRYNGYGMSELEDMIYIITSQLWSDEYNSRFFSQGSMPKGLIIANNVNSTKLQQFRQEWLSMVTGVQNAWRTPILEADKFNYVDIHKTNKDMEFQEWKNYLIKLCCALFKIDPSEIGFPMDHGGGNSMFKSGDKQKLDHSKQKGLKPLLKFYQRQLNKSIVSRLDNRFELVFVGTDIESEQAEDDRLIAAVGSYMMVNEARKIKGLPERPEFDIIANPVVQQSIALAKMGDPQSNDFVDNDTKQKAIDPFVLDYTNYLEEILK